MSRVLAWFSCGDASAVAAKLACEKYGARCEVLYCDTFAYEHPDNKRFFNDVQEWLGRKIKILRSPDYKDIWDVFEKTRFLRDVRSDGARCTTELKKNVRKAYQEADDIHVFGFTIDETMPLCRNPKKDRVAKFYRGNPELFVEFPLVDNNITKADCHQRMKDAAMRERGVIGGKPLPFSDKEIKDALKEAKGSLAGAAKILKCAVITIKRRKKMWKSGKKLQLKVKK